MHDPENYLIAILLLSHVAVAIVAAYGGMVFGTKREKEAAFIHELRLIEHRKRTDEARAKVVRGIFDKGHQKIYSGGVE